MLVMLLRLVIGDAGDSRDACDEDDRDRHRHRDHVHDDNNDSMMMMMTMTMTMMTKKRRAYSVRHIDLPPSPKPKTGKPNNTCRNTHYVSVLRVNNGRVAPGTSQPKL